MLKLMAILLLLRGSTSWKNEKQYPRWGLQQGEESPPESALSHLLHPTLIDEAMLAEPSYPCPEPADFLPCTCTVIESSIMDLDCSAATSQEDLQAAFSITMSFTTYRTLSIIQDPPASDLQDLTIDTFGQCSFEQVHIKGTALREVQDGAFAKSQERLKILDLASNDISSFPFETLNDYILLEELTLTNNKLEVVDNLKSESLKSLRLDNNPTISFVNNLFVACDELLTIDLSSCDITDLTLYNFGVLTKLETVNLSGNQLTFLGADSIKPSGETLISVTVSDNPLSEVMEGAFGGLQTTAKLVLKNTQLVELPETVWLPYADSLEAEAIDLEGNPLRCGCDMAWMYETATNFNLKFSDTTTCSDTSPIHGLNPDFFDYHCK